MWFRLKSAATSRVRQCPPIARFLNKHLRRKRFRIEKALIRGTHINHNPHPSILHFSINKAATQSIKSILKRCALENGMTPVEIHEYAFNSDFPFLDHLSAEEMKAYRHIFKPEGYLYSAFGGMIEGIRQLDRYKTVFVGRDPRDILVSGYYSIAFSHSLPERKGDKFHRFMANRESARAVTIDAYVRSQAERVFQIFQRYQQLLLDRYDHVYVTTYEQMVTDFEAWLRQLLAYCELEVSEELFTAIVKENERRKPRTENIQHHMRKGRPGDYKEKLQPETIAYLNATFEPILRCFNYP